MKKLLLFLVMAYGAFHFYQKRFAPAADMPADAIVIEDNAPYVAMYGRESCGFTRKMLADLDRSEMEYKFFNVDERRVAAPLRVRMRQKGLDPSNVPLPVVEVDGQMSIRPKFAKVSSMYLAMDD